MGAVVQMEDSGMNEEWDQQRGLQIKAGKELPGKQRLSYTGMGAHDMHQLTGTKVKGTRSGL